jgi:hypothetical protein
MHSDIEMYAVHARRFDVLHIHENHASISHITYRQKREVVMKNTVSYSLFLEDKQLTGSMVTDISGYPTGPTFKGQLFNFVLLDSRRWDRKVVPKRH